MRIEILNEKNGHTGIFEAVVSSDGLTALYFEGEYSDGGWISWSVGLPDFQVLSDAPVIQHKAENINQFFTQELAELNVKFK